MSIWLTHTPPLAQTPDSLSRTDTPQEPDTQAVQHADTAGTDVPHREAETADTAHAAPPPGQQPHRLHPHRPIPYRHLLHPPRPTACRYR